MHLVISTPYTSSNLGLFLNLTLTFTNFTYLKTKNKNQKTSYIETIVDSHANVRNNNKQEVAYIHIHFLPVTTYCIITSNITASHLTLT